MIWEDNFKNACIDGGTALLDAGGYIEAQTSGDVEVATYTLSATAFADAVAGSALANAIGSDTGATGGVIAKCKLYTVGAALVGTGTATITGGGGDFTFDTLTVAASGIANLTSVTIPFP